MQISDVLNNKSKEHREIITCLSSETVRDAVAKLVGHEIGAVVVLEDHEVVGVFSEGVVVRLAHGEGPGFRDTQLSEVMSKDVVDIAPDQEVSLVLNLMKENKVRHLIVKENDRLIGILSLSDLTLFNIEHAKRTKEFLTQQVIDHSKPIPM